MSTYKKSKYNYKCYWRALSVVLFLCLCSTAAYIHSLYCGTFHQSWLSVLVGILWGLCFSILTAFLIKCSDDKRYDNAQKSFVKNLHDYYLKNFRQALKNYAMYYVNAFKPSPANYKVFKNIPKDNQIDVDALIYNFSALQYIKDSVPKATGTPCNKAEWLVNDLGNLCMVKHTHYYLHYYYELCKESNKVVSIAKIENEKYDYPIFSEDELVYLENYDNAGYYYKMSHDLQDKSPQKFDNFNLQDMFQWFRKVNKQLKLFKIDLTPIEFHTPTKEEMKTFDEDYGHFQTVAKEGEKAAESIIDEYKTQSRR